VNSSLYLDATIQILTFGPIIRGFGGSADDMAAVWTDRAEMSTRSRR
jgi:hypothetical protein